MNRSFYDHDLRNYDDVRRLWSKLNEYGYSPNVYSNLVMLIKNGRARKKNLSRRANERQSTA